MLRDDEAGLKKRTWRRTLHQDELEAAQVLSQSSAIDPQGRGGNVLVRSHTITRAFGSLVSGLRSEKSLNSALTSLQ